LITNDYVSHHHELDRDQKKHLKLKALSGKSTTGWRAAKPNGRVSFVNIP
jgi:hypothetical protein